MASLPPLLCRTPGRGRRRPADRQVSLLWPAAEPGGYSLIVDGTGACGQADDGPALTVKVTRAVLHRRGAAPAGSSSPCGSDCLPFIG